jgi:hypothetical protein
MIASEHCEARTHARAAPRTSERRGKVDARSKAAAAQRYSPHSFVKLSYCDAIKLPSLWIIICCYAETTFGLNGLRSSQNAKIA